MPVFYSYCCNGRPDKRLYPYRAADYNSYPANIHCSHVRTNADYNASPADNHSRHVHTNANHDTISNPNT